MVGEKFATIDCGRQRITARKVSVDALRLPVQQTSAAPNLTSSLLASIGVAHGFSTRCGGVSRGVFDSLNFGNPGELAAEERDPGANIARNFRVLLDACGVEEPERKELVQVYQVHGGKTHIVRRGAVTHPGSPDPETGETRDTKADAIVTDDPHRVLCIRTADCTPVLLASGDGRVVGAVHAGWRGVIAGIASSAVEAMRSLGARDIAACIGPCISVRHFEVGPEVVAEFRRVFGDAGPWRVVDPANPVSKGFVDLQAALALQLREAGVASIETLALCTVERGDLFFSHRRDKGRTGRMAAIIGPR